jgi:hypothetical protein
MSNKMSAIFSAIGAGFSNKYYLEQQLIPMQVYMDDIDTIIKHLPSETYKCRLRELEYAYRDAMGFDQSVRIRTSKNNFELFKALRLKFESSNDSNKLLHKMFPQVTLGNDPFIVFNEDITKLVPNEEQRGSETDVAYVSVYKTKEYKGNPISGYTYKYKINYWFNDKLLGETKPMWFDEVQKITKEIRLLKGLSSVYIQPYDTTAEGKYDDLLDECSDEFTWVDKTSIYRGVYQPLSPFTCGNIKEVKFKCMNNNGWSTEALSSVIKGWLQVEYIYLAMKSMFEELGTLASLELKEQLAVHNSNIQKGLPIAHAVPMAPGIDEMFSRTQKKRGHDHKYSMST